MKRLSEKGFTLIELLAVITIMGILMIVAIPAISRTIENSRRDMFADTAKQYINSVKTMWESDSLECQVGDEFLLPSEIMASSSHITSVYVNIDSTKVDTGVEGYYPALLESGGKSSWGNKDVFGYVNIMSYFGDDGKKIANFAIVLDDGTHGIKNSTGFSSIDRSSVQLSGTSAFSLHTTSYCKTF